MKIHANGDLSIGCLPGLCVGREMSVECSWNWNTRL